LRILYKPCIYGLCKAASVRPYSPVTGENGGLAEAGFDANPGAQVASPP
jgi:hypothetical protein